MQKLHPDLDAVLTQLGATEIEKLSLVSYLVNAYQQASAVVSGIESNIIGLEQQKIDMASQKISAESNAQRMATMLGKFTIAEEEQPPEEPLPEEPTE